MNNKSPYILMFDKIRARVSKIGERRDECRLLSECPPLQLISDKLRLCSGYSERIEDFLVNLVYIGADS